MKRLLYILALGTILSSCEREKGYEGPSLIDQFGDFSVIDSLQVTNTNVAFAAGETSVFNAEFSKSVNWELTITGAVSGAQKVMSGYSRLLDEDNATWDGSTTKLPMFKSEECSVNLQVSYKEIVADSVISVTDSIISLADLAVTSTKENDGFLISDFETSPNALWDLFLQGGQMNVSSTGASPQGNSFYDMKGTCSWDWLIGLATIPGSAYGEGTNFDLSDNPDQVYFNVLLNFPQDVQNPPIVLFNFREDDNQDGEFTVGQEDVYSIEIKDLDPGWQLVSVKYSDLQTLADGLPVSPVGNAVKESNKINHIEVLFLAPQGNGFSQAYMDYMIFTEDQPLNP